MKKIKEVAPSETGKLIYSSKKPKHMISDYRVIYYFLLIIIFISIILLVITQLLFFVILIFMAFSMIVLNYLSYKGGKFDIYENGFITRIYVRPKDPERIHEKPNGIRFIKYSEINKIYRIGRNKTKKIIMSDINWVRIDIKPIFERYSILIPHWDLKNITKYLIFQIQKKRIDVEIDDSILELIKYQKFLKTRTGNHV